MLNGDSCAKSIRLALLETILPYVEQLSIRVPSFCCLSHMDIPEEFNDEAKLNRNQVLEWAVSIRDKLLDETFSLASDRIFVRVCPLDDVFRPDLSFAGVYASSAPQRNRSRAHTLIHGLVQVIMGRFTDYANYYYARHKITGKRSVDVMFSTCVEECVMFGTAYVYGDRCLLEYYDDILAISLRDPKRLAADRNSALKGIDHCIVKSMFDLNEIIERPLDIEFLVNRREQVFITEIRPISSAHLKNWKNVASASWQQTVATCPPANVLNSIGQIEGQIVDLRSKKPELDDFDHTEDRIHIINHERVREGTSSLELLRFIHEHDLSGITLVIDHLESRKDNHLQYIMFEDPGLSFIVNVTDIPNRFDRERLSVKSDGFRSVLTVGGR